MSNAELDHVAVEHYSLALQQENNMWYTAGVRVV